MGCGASTTTRVAPAHAPEQTGLSIRGPGETSGTTDATTNATNTKQQLTATEERRPSQSISVSISRPEAAPQSRPRPHLRIPSFDNDASDAGTARSSRAHSRQTSLGIPSPRSMRKKSTLSGGGVMSIKIKSDARTSLLSARAVNICHNCEAPDAEIAVHCLDCSKEGKPALFCEDCNFGLHRPVKMRNHKRVPHSGGIAGVSFPPTTPTSPTTPASPTVADSAAEGNGGEGRGAPSPVHSESKAAASYPAEPVESLVPEESEIELEEEAKAIAAEVAASAQRPTLFNRNLSISASARGPPAHHRGSSVSGNTAPKEAASSRGETPSARRKSLSESSTSSVEEEALENEFRSLRTMPKVVVRQAQGSRMHSVTPNVGNTGSAPGTSPAAQPSTPVSTASSAGRKRYSTSIALMQDETKLARPVRKAAAGEVYRVQPDTMQFGDALKPVLPLHRQLFSGQVVSVACGLNHAAAITSEGCLFMWGQNDDGQCGVGENKGSELAEPVLVPVGVPKGKSAVEVRKAGGSPVAYAGLKVVQVACGYRHTLALVESGEVYSWGSGFLGCLGHGGDADSSVPKPVKMDKDQKATYVACGQYNSAFVANSPKHPTTIYVWGAGEGGQIGNGELAPKLLPTAADMSLVGDCTVVSVALGNNHAAAVTDTGRLFTWGDNEFGQLGLGKEQSYRTMMKPHLVGSLFEQKVKILQVMCGERHTSAVTNYGQTYSWGSGETHQIGIMDNVDQWYPIEAKVASGPKPTDTAVVRDACVGQSITAVCTDSGEVWMWGFGLETAVPKRIDFGGEFVSHISVGSNDNIIALTAACQKVYVWYFDSENSDESEENRPLEYEDLRGKSVVSASCGLAHNAVVGKSGQVMIWGDNDDGQLGTGTDKSLHKPTKLVMPNSVLVAQIACGAEHTIAATVQGAVYSWGNGQLGRLGHGNDTSQPKPKLVEALKPHKISFVSVGAFNSGAVTSTGELWLWGSGGDGQLAKANNDTTPSFKPTKATGLPKEKVTKFGIGNQHAACICEGGSVYTWGNNDFGQLGITPGELIGVQKVASLPGKAVQIGCGQMTVVILNDQGDVFAWGSGETDQTCTDGEDQFTPKKIVFPSPAGKPIAEHMKITQLSVGPITCGALTDTGFAFVWGWGLGETPTVVGSQGGKPLGNVSIMACGTHALILACDE